MNAELLKNKTGGLNQKDINESKADNKSYEIITALRVSNAS